MRKLLSLWTVLFLLLPLAVRAQDALVIDTIKTGTLPAGGAATYSMAIPLAGSYLISLAEIEPGLAPQFAVTTATGAPVVTATNTALTPSLDQTVTFPQSGSYLVSVTSSIGAGGRFVIVLQPGQPLPPPLPLTVGQPAAGSIPATGSQRITFNGDPLNVMSLSIIGQVRSELTDSAGTPYGHITSLLPGGSLLIPAGTTAYVLTLTNDTATPSVNFNLSLRIVEAVSPPPGATIPPPAATLPPAATTRPLPVLPVTGACQLATREASFVNVRSTPSTEGNTPIGQISPYELYSVVGRTADAAWYEINFSGGRGWVALSVTRIGGDCASVPITFIPIQITLPPAVTAAPTAPIAGDNEVSTQINYGRDLTLGYNGALSYPEGNRQDTIAWTLVDVPSNLPSDAQFRYSIRCTGDGLEFAEIVFSNGSTQPCRDTQSNFVQSLTSTSARSDSLTIRLTGGSNAYVTWRVSFSYYVP